jgi:hypothetical protein
VPAPEWELIDLFIAPLENADLGGYMISGSVASIEFGEPRATLDINIALSLSLEETLRLPSLFPAPDFYCPPAEILALEVTRPARGHFKVIHVVSGLKADFYPSTRHPLFSWAMQNRSRHRVAGSDVWFAPPEYVILWKLEFYREGGERKHLRDIRGMLLVSETGIDRTIIERGVALRRLEEEWKVCVG